MGFFNFYLSVGLSLWAIDAQPEAGDDRQSGRRSSAGGRIHRARAGGPSGRSPRWLTCGPLADCPPDSGFALLAIAMCGMLGLRFWIVSRYQDVRVFSSGPGGQAAVDQVWTFGLKYCAVSIGLTLLWGFLLLGVSHRKGFIGTASDIPLSVVYFDGVWDSRLPHQNRAAAVSHGSYVHQRKDDAALCGFCSAPSSPRPIRPNGSRSRSFPLGGGFTFSLLYVDTRAMNRVEQQMETLTARLSTSDRVFSALTDPLSRGRAPWGT